MAGAWDASWIRLDIIGRLAGSSNAPKARKSMSKMTDQKAVAAANQNPDWQAYVEDFRRAGHETVDWIARYLSTVRDMPVLAQTRPGELLDALPQSAPEKGEPFSAILSDFD